MNISGSMFKISPKQASANTDGESKPATRVPSGRQGGVIPRATGSITNHEIPYCHV